MDPRFKSTGLEEGCCVFCDISDQSEERYGKYLHHPDTGISAHYYCMLFACGLSQGGESNEGLEGFLIEDILSERKRAQKLKCKYCKKKGASVGCSVRACHQVYHYGCGVDEEAIFLFYDSFVSYCVKHRPTQKVLPSSCSPSKGTCPICIEKVDTTPGNKVLKTPCCKGTWLHRDCVQMQALSAGYFFRCAICNNENEFQDEMRKFGIYIPEKDAEWEYETNAYQELYERHNRCDVDRCRCPKGRRYCTQSGQWEIVLCDLCGSAGCHMACGGLVSSLDDWACRDCTSLFTQGLLQQNNSSHGRGHKKNTSTPTMPNRNTGTGGRARSAIRSQGKRPRPPPSTPRSVKKKRTEAPVCPPLSPVTHSQSFTSSPKSTPSADIFPKVSLSPTYGPNESRPGSSTGSYENKYRNLIPRLECYVALKPTPKKERYHLQMPSLSPADGTGSMHKRKCGSKVKCKKARKLNLDACEHQKQTTAVETPSINLFSKVDEKPKERKSSIASLGSSGENGCTVQEKPAAKPGWGSRLLGSVSSVGSFIWGRSKSSKSTPEKENPLQKELKGSNKQPIAFKEQSSDSRVDQPIETTVPVELTEKVKAYILPVSKEQVSCKKMNMLKDLTSWKDDETWRAAKGDLAVLFQIDGRATRSTLKNNGLEPVSSETSICSSPGKGTQKKKYHLPPSTVTNPECLKNSVSRQGSGHKHNNVHLDTSEYLIDTTLPEEVKATILPISPDKISKPAFHELNFLTSWKDNETWKEAKTDLAFLFQADGRVTRRALQKEKEHPQTTSQITPRKMEVKRKLVPGKSPRKRQFVTVSPVQGNRESSTEHDKSDRTEFDGSLGQAIYEKQNGLKKNWTEAIVPQNVCTKNPSGAENGESNTTEHVSDMSSNQEIIQPSSYNDDLVSVEDGQQSSPQTRTREAGKAHSEAHGVLKQILSVVLPGEAHSKNEQTEKEHSQTTSQMTPKKMELKGKSEHETSSGDKLFISASPLPVQKGSSPDIQIMSSTQINVDNLCESIPEKQNQKDDEFSMMPQGNYVPHQVASNIVYASPGKASHTKGIKSLHDLTSWKDDQTWKEAKTDLEYLMQVDGRRTRTGLKKDLSEGIAPQNENPVIAGKSESNTPKSVPKMSSNQELVHPSSKGKDSQEHSSSEPTIGSSPIKERTIKDVSATVSRHGSVSKHFHHKSPEYLIDTTLPEEVKATILPISADRISKPALQELNFLTSWKDNETWKEAKTDLAFLFQADGRVTRRALQKEKEQPQTSSQITPRKMEVKRKLVPGKSPRSKQSASPIQGQRESSLKQVMSKGKAFEGSFGVLVTERQNPKPTNHKLPAMPHKRDLTHQMVSNKVPASPGKASYVKGIKSLHDLTSWKDNQTWKEAKTDLAYLVQVDGRRTRTGLKKDLSEGIVHRSIHFERHDISSTNVSEGSSNEEIAQRVTVEENKLSSLQAGPVETEETQLQTDGKIKLGVDTLSSVLSVEPLPKNEHADKDICLEEGESLECVLQMVDGIESENGGNIDFVKPKGNERNTGAHGDHADEIEYVNHVMSTNVDDSSCRSHSKDTSVIEHKDDTQISSTTGTLNNGLVHQEVPVTPVELSSPSKDDGCLSGVSMQHYDKMAPGNERKGGSVRIGNGRGNPKVKQEWTHCVSAFNLDMLTSWKDGNTWKGATSDLLALCQLEGRTSRSKLKSDGQKVTPKSTPTKKDGLSKSLGKRKDITKRMSNKGSSFSASPPLNLKNNESLRAENDSAAKTVASHACSHKLRRGDTDSCHHVSDNFVLEAKESNNSDNLASEVGGQEVCKKGEIAKCVAEKNGKESLKRNSRGQFISDVPTPPTSPKLPTLLKGEHIENQNTGTSNAANTLEGTQDAEDIVPASCLPNVLKISKTDGEVVPRDPVAEKKEDVGSICGSLVDEFVTMAMKKSSHSKTSRTKFDPSQTAWNQSALKGALVSNKDEDKGQSSLNKPSSQKLKKLMSWSEGKTWEAAKNDLTELLSIDDRVTRGSSKKQKETPSKVLRPGSGTRKRGYCCSHMRKPWTSPPGKRRIIEQRTLSEQKCQNVAMEQHQQIPTSEAGSLDQNSDLKRKHGRSRILKPTRRRLDSSNKRLPVDQGQKEEDLSLSFSPLQKEPVACPGTAEEALSQTEATSAEVEACIISNKRLNFRSVQSKHTSFQSEGLVNGDQEDSKTRQMASLEYSDKDEKFAGDRTWQFKHGVGTTSEELLVQSHNALVDSLLSKNLIKVVSERDHVEKSFKDQSSQTISSVEDVESFVSSKGKLYKEPATIPPMKRKKHGSHAMAYTQTYNLALGHRSRGKLPAGAVQGLKQKANQESSKALPEPSLKQNVEGLANNTNFAGDESLVQDLATSSNNVHCQELVKESSKKKRTDQETATDGNFISQVFELNFDKSLADGQKALEPSNVSREKQTQTFFHMRSKVKNLAQTTNNSLKQHLNLTGIQPRTIQVNSLGSLSKPKKQEWFRLKPKK